MKQNINRAGRAWRFGIAVLLAVIALWQRSWIAGALSVFVFYEVLAGWCPFMQLVGKNSCKIEEPKK